MMKMSLRFLALSALLLLSSCDKNTLQALLGDQGQVKIADRNLPASGDGTINLWRVSGTYELTGAEVTLWGAEFNSNAITTHLLRQPGKMDLGDSFSSVSEWAPEDDQKVLYVLFCMPVKLVLTAGDRPMSNCNYYKPTVRERQGSLDFFPSENGLMIFDAFRRGEHQGDVYSLTGTTGEKISATAQPQLDGTLRLVLQVDFNVGSGKPFPGAAKKYFIDLRYKRTS
jgi:hypothetical protein